MPARVHAFSAGTSAQPCRRSRRRCWSLVTALQEQTCAAPGSAAAPTAGLAGRRQQRQRGRGQRPADAGPQRRVGAGVADQHAAEQRLRVVGEDQLGVDPGGRVGERDVEAARGGAVRVAERGHVDAEQLELGGRCPRRGRWPRRRAAGRRPPRPSRTRGRPGRSTRAVRRAAHSPTAQIRSVGRPAGRRRPARRRAARAPARPPGPARRGAGCRRRTTTRSASTAPPSESSSAATAPSGPGRSAVAATPECGRLTPELLDVAAQHRAAAPRRPAAASAGARTRPRGWSGPSSRSAFAASRPSRPPPITAPVAPARRRTPGCAVQVVEGPVDEDTGQVRAGHRRHERRTTRWRAPARRTGTRRPRCVTTRAGPVDVDAPARRAAVAPRRPGCAGSAPRRSPRRSRPTGAPGRTRAAAPRPSTVTRQRRSRSRARSASTKPLPDHAVADDDEPHPRRLHRARPPAESAWPASRRCRRPRRGSCRSRWRPGSPRDQPVDRPGAGRASSATSAPLVTVLHWQTVAASGISAGDAAGAAGDRAEGPAEQQRPPVAPAPARPGRRAGSPCRPPGCRRAGSRRSAGRRGSRSLAYVPRAGSAKVSSSPASRRARRRRPSRPGRCRPP